MSTTTEISSSFKDVTMLKLARELAMDMRPLEAILATHEVTSDEWGVIANHPVFQGYLRGALEEWQSATNTQERVRLKSLSFVEEALPEFFARAHDPKETLASKIEVLKTISKFAGVGGTVEGAIAGERMVVNINLGADHQLHIEKDYTVIEGEAL